LLLVALPSTAFADMGFWRWLDKLSGPGPFRGIVLDPAIVCIGHNERGDRTRVTAVYLYDCDLVRAERHIRLGTDIGILTGKNNLDPSRGTVAAYPVLFNGAIGTSYFDVGAAFGFVRFVSGPSSATEGAIQPIRITFRPFAIPENRRQDFRARALQIRLTTTYLAGALTAADFNAPSSSWTGGNEWVTSLMFTVDAGALVWGSRYRGR
jgi:hypothetical protein